MSTFYVRSGVTSTGQVNSGDTFIVSSGGTYAAYKNGGVYAINGTVDLDDGSVLNGGLIGNGGRVSAASSAILSGQIIVSSGGVVSGGSADWLIVKTGGLDVATTAGSGHFLDFESGASGRAITVESGAQLFVRGATVTGATIESGGTAYVSSGGTITNGTEIYGTIVGSGSGAFVNGYVESGGLIIAKDGADLYWDTVKSGGSAVASSGGIISSGIAENGATITVSSGGTISDFTANAGGNVLIENGGAISGYLNLSGNASATIPDNAGGVIALYGESATITITGSNSPTTVISGFKGSSSSSSDEIVFSDINKDDVASITYPDANHMEITLKNGSSLSTNIIGVKNFGYELTSNSDGDLVYEVCFLEDTEISTPFGMKLVQDFQPGDLVSIVRNNEILSDTVTWAGHAHCVVRPELSDDAAGYPVRILKNAIQENVPSKDLLITAEHCLFFDGKFIPARMLVNGRSIFYDKTINNYSYFHIETEKHSVIMANGLLTESYLDTGNRSQFVQKGNIFRFGKATKSWDKDAAAPLTVSADVVESLHRKIASRAKNLNLPAKIRPIARTDNQNLHLITDDGLKIIPVRSSGDKVLFMVPGKVKTLRIMSNSSRPCDILGPFIDDRRYLGVLVGDITLYDSSTTSSFTAHFHDKNLSGWNNIEPDLMRWTAGNALLHLGTRDHGTFGMLSIQIYAGGPYLEEEKSAIKISSVI